MANHIERVTAMLEAVVDELMDEERVLRVINNLFALTGRDGTGMDDEQRAAVVLQLARMHFQAGVRSGAEARKNQTAPGTIQAMVQQAGLDAVKDV